MIDPWKAAGERSGHRLDTTVTVAVFPPRYRCSCGTPHSLTEWRKLVEPKMPPPPSPDLTGETGKSWIG